MTIADLTVLVNRGDVLPTDLIKCGADAPFRPAGETPSLFGATAAIHASPSATESHPEDSDFDLASDEVVRRPDEAFAELSPAEESPADEPPADDETAAGERPDSERPLAQAPAVESPAEQNVESPAEAPGTKPAAADRRRKVLRLAAACGILVVVGSAAGALTGLLMPAASPAQAAANPPSPENSQRIEALRRQIAELQAERERIDKAAQALVTESRAVKPEAEAPADSPVVQ